MRKSVIRFLKEPEWIEGLQDSTSYSRQHDDTDGAENGILSVYFLNNGDACISIDEKILRFRNFGGGGRSLHTHAALMILAKAIQMDNESRGGFPF